MKLYSAAMAMFCVAAAASAPAQQPKDKPKQGNTPQPAATAKDQPKVAVIANLQVNVSTQINVGAAPAKPSPAVERKPKRAKEASPSNPALAADQSPPRGAGIVVIANVKIDVATTVHVNPSATAVPPNTSLKVTRPPGTPGKATAAKEVSPQQKTAPAKPPAAPVANAGSSQPGGNAGNKPADDSTDDLFELHVRVRRRAGRVDVLLAGTVPSAEGAKAAARHINQVQAQGMFGLLVLPLILKGDPETHRALRDAWASIKAEASGPRLSLTASLPDEAIAAASQALAAARQFAQGLMGRQ